MMTLSRCDGEVEVALVVDNSEKAREVLGSDLVLAA
jgi:hypothetical protein